MPVTEFIQKLDPPPPPKVLEAAATLHYRDFLTVCLIVNRPHVFPDNWIYITTGHERGVVRAFSGRIYHFTCSCLTYYAGGFRSDVAHRRCS